MLQSSLLNKQLRKRWGLSIHLKRELPPRTHNLVELLKALGIDREDLVDAAMDLTPEYVVTCYPDAANGVPAYLYNERIAKEHLEKARLIIGYCRTFIKVVEYESK